MTDAARAEPVTVEDVVVRVDSFAGSLRELGFVVKEDVPNEALAAGFVGKRGPYKVFVALLTVDVKRG